MLTPSVSVSSLVTASPADSSVVFSSDGVAPSAVNLQSSERLDRARGTFRGFLNITSTMIGSVGTERWPYTKQVTQWKKKIVPPDWLASVGMSQRQVRSKGRGSRGALTLGYSQWEAQVVCLAVQAALGGVESCWDNPPVGCSHKLFLQVAPHDCQVLIDLSAYRSIKDCIECSSTTRLVKRNRIRCSSIGHPLSESDMLQLHWHLFVKLHTLPQHWASFSGITYVAAALTFVSGIALSTIFLFQALYKSYYCVSLSQNVYVASLSIS